jgi:hypothetical protein
MELKAGIICHLNYFRCYNLKQYYYTITNLYEGCKIVLSKDDLMGLDILFIGDDHHQEHVDIFTQPGFVERCNELDIKVVVMTSERIVDSFFPKNIEKYEFIKRFKNLYHYTSDVDDCKKLGTKLHRTLFSNCFSNWVESNIGNKIDRAIFIGNTTSGCYQERKEILKSIHTVIPVDIFQTSLCTYREYLEKISKYRFIFSPIGNGNSFTLRFYEALLIKSIPIHQVRNNTLELYDQEAKFDDCIFFEKIDELPEKIKNFKLKNSLNNIWFEDYLKELLTKDALI